MMPDRPASKPVSQLHKTVDDLAMSMGVNSQNKGGGGIRSFLHTRPTLKNNFSSDLSHFKIEIHFFIK